MTSKSLVVAEGAIFVGQSIMGEAAASAGSAPKADAAAERAPEAAKAGA